MSILRFLKQDELQTLKDNISNNLETYRSGKSTHFPAEETVTFESEITADIEALKECNFSKDHRSEAFNCRETFEAFSELTPELAREERLWAALTHYHFLDEARERWPIPEDDDKAINHIKDHFFASNARGIERGNFLSRMWWMAHIVNRCQTGNLEDNLKVFLLKSDVRANIVERPSTFRNDQLFSAMFDVLRDAYKQYEKSEELGVYSRERFRAISTRLNELGGYKLLDAMEYDTLKKMIVEANQEYCT